MAGNPTTNLTRPWSDDLVLLYCEHFDSLVRKTAQIVKSRAIAEELVQEAFVTFHTRDCQPKPGSEAAYLRSIALNAARSSIRRNACEDRHRVATEDQESVEAWCIRRREAVDLAMRVRQLPEQQRRVVEMRYWEGLNEREIAAKLNISPGSVKTHASRARSRLRSELLSIR